MYPRISKALSHLNRLNMNGSKFGLDLLRVLMIGGMLLAIDDKFDNPQDIKSGWVRESFLPLLLVGLLVWISAMIEETVKNIYRRDPLASSQVGEETPFLSNTEIQQIAHGHWYQAAYPVFLTGKAYLALGFGSVGGSLAMLNDILSRCGKEMPGQVGLSLKIGLTALLTVSLMRLQMQRLGRQRAVEHLLGDSFPENNIKKPSLMSFFHAGVNTASAIAGVGFVAALEHDAQVPAPYSVWIGASLFGLCRQAQIEDDVRDQFNQQVIASQIS